LGKSAEGLKQAVVSRITAIDGETVKNDSMEKKNENSTPHRWLAIFRCGGAIRG
jgi:hypothetical protein